MQLLTHNCECKIWNVGFHGLRKLILVTCVDKNDGFVTLNCSCKRAEERYKYKAKTFLTTQKHVGMLFV